MNNMQWLCHEPVFECDRLNEEILLHSPWAGHRNFAYDYVSNMKPTRIVELGSYYGCSSFAFLQAIKDHHLQTEFFAVDTWCGDSFTQTDYQEDIFGAFKQINDSCFAGVRSTMLRKTFDEACLDFPDGSIDLLHIDGSHNYEDVKNDYTRWRSKLRPDGVVFFHDVGRDLLFGEPMGSHIYWEELKREHPYTIEFPFSNGLGLLFASEQVYRLVRDSIDPAHYQNLLNLQDTRNKDRIRKDHFIIRDLKYYNGDLIRQTEVLKHHLERYQQDTAAADAYRQQLEQRCADNACAMSEKEAQLQSLQKLQEQSSSDLAKLDVHLRQKDDRITGLLQQVEQMDLRTEHQESYIRELKQQVDDLNRFADSKEAYIRELEQQANDLNRFADSKEAYIRELEQQVNDLNRFADSKEAYICELEQQKAESEAFRTALENDIHTLLSQQRELCDFVDSKERYIRQLEQQKAELTVFASEKDTYANQLQQQMLQLQSRLDAQTEAYTEMHSCCTRVQEENRILRQDISTLLERLGKLPFGRRLYQDINFINSDNEES